MSARISFTRIGDAAAPTVLVMLHGIYGQGRNWQTVAKRLVEARPDVQCLLVDLPYHGASGPGTHGETVDGLAADLNDWLARDAIVPSALLGHSFGGKVALAMTAARQDGRLQLWLVDSTPDARAASGGAWELLQTIRSLPDRFPSRDEAVRALTDRGWAPALGQWMATNLSRVDDEFRWRLDFDVMERLLRDFFSSDFRSTVEDAPALHTFHVIKATSSSVLSDETVGWLEGIGAPRVHVYRLDGGHWIHAEKPDDVVALLARALPGTAVPG